MLPEQLRTENISTMQLAALYEVSKILNASLNYQQATDDILKVLHESAMLEHGMLALLDSQGEQLEVDALYCEDSALSTRKNRVQYKSGEGIVGMVFSQGESIVIPMISDDFRFAGKLDIYDWGKPFIAVPLKTANGKIV